MSRFGCGLEAPAGQGVLRASLLHACSRPLVVRGELARDGIVFGASEYRTTTDLYIRPSVVPLAQAQTTAELLGILGRCSATCRCWAAAQDSHLPEGAEVP
jgi:hypothetical protein